MTKREFQHGIRHRTRQILAAFAEWYFAETTQGGMYACFYRYISTRTLSERAIWLNAVMPVQNMQPIRAVREGDKLIG